MNRQSPAWLVEADTLDDAVGRLLSLRSGGSNTNHKDTLSTLLRKTAFDYNEVTAGMQWRNSTQELPMSAVCNALTVQQLSELAIQFRHHIGLSLSNVQTVNEFILSSYSVRILGNCSEYQHEKLMLQASNFITRLDFIRHTKLDPTFLSNVVLSIKGKHYNIAEWYPMLIARWKLLFHPSSNSNYYRYLTNGIITFIDNECFVRMITKERLEQQIAKNINKYAGQLIYDFHIGKGARPPYSLVLDTPTAYWKKHFGDQHKQIRDLMLSSYMEHAALSTDQAIRLAVLMSNRKLSKTSIGDFELTLQSITAMGNLRAHLAQSALSLPDRSLPEELDTDPHIRTKRHPILLFISGVVRTLTLWGQRLVTFFKGWSGTVIGSSLARSVRNVYTNFQGTARGFTSQLRTEHSLRQVVNNMGSAQRSLVPYVRLRSWPGSLPQRVRQMRFGPNRFSSLQLPTPISRQLAQYSPMRLRLKQRIVDGFAWTRKNSLLLSSTAATLGLFVAGLDITSDPYYSYNYNPNSTQSQPQEDDPHVWEASKSWPSVAEATFTYDPLIISESERKSLQADMFGHSNETSREDSADQAKAHYYDEKLHEAYDEKVISIYDLSLPQDLRKASLLRSRTRNQIVRELDSMSLMCLRYGQRSDLHKRAMESAELFFGVLMHSQEAMLPSERFMDTLLQDVVSNGNLQQFIDEVREYVDLVFLQIQESWTPEMKRMLTQTVEGLKGKVSEDDLVNFMTTTDPNAKEIFKLVLRKKGRDHILSFNRQLDFVLSAESERKFWKNQFGSHRLLWESQPLEIPNKNQDYLVVLFWYQLYLAEDGIKDQLDAFVRAMTRLSMIRMYEENRAVGMSVASLEAQIAPSDLKVLKESGLKGIARTPLPGQGTTFTDYSTLMDVANSDYEGSILEYTPSESDYSTDTDNILTNSLTGVNDVRKNEDVIIAEKNRRKKRDLHKQQQIHIMVKRSAENILRNLTMDNAIRRELELFNEDPSRSALLRKRMKMARRPLTLGEILKLQDEVQLASTFEGTTVANVKLSHQKFLASTLQYLEAHVLPGEIMALLMEPEQASSLPMEQRSKIQAAHRVLKIKPLSSLMEKRALMDYILTLEESNKERTTHYYYDFLAAICFILVIVHLIVLFTHGWRKYKAYTMINTDAPLPSGNNVEM